MAREQWSDEVLRLPEHLEESGGAEDTGGDEGGGGGYSPPGDEAAKNSYFNKWKTGATSGIPGKTGWHQTLGTLRPVDATQWSGIDPASFLKSVSIPVTGDEGDDTKEDEEGNGAKPDLPPDWWEKYSDTDTYSEFFTWLEQNKGMQFGAGFNFGGESEEAWDKYWDEYQASLAGDGGGADPDDEDVIVTDDPDDFVPFDPLVPDDPRMEGDLETDGTGTRYGPTYGRLDPRGDLSKLGRGRAWYDRPPTARPNYMEQWQNLPMARPRAAVDQWSTLDIPTPPSSIYEPAPGLNFQDLMSNWAEYTPQAGGGGGLPFYSQGSMQELLRRLGGR